MEHHAPTPNVLRGENKDCFKRYYPIESYGIIGNMRTSAHVCKDTGSIDWFCFPHFSSPSMFGRLLDSGRGGYFMIDTCSRAKTTKQQYWPDTNILVTRFHTEEGVGQVIDFMPVVETPQAFRDPDTLHRHHQQQNSSSGDDDSSSSSPTASPHTSGTLRSKLSSKPSSSLSSSVPNYLADRTLSETDRYQCIVRRIEVIHGSMCFKTVCVPAFNYARDEHDLNLSGDGKRATFTSRGRERLSMTLESDQITLSAFENTADTGGGGGGAGVQAEFCLEENGCIIFVFREATAEEKCPQDDSGSNADVTTKDSGSSSSTVRREIWRSSASLTARTEWLFVQTMRFWQDWLSKSIYTGRYREQVHRSALLLKLLTFEPTGAMVAAPTTSLPENIGGVRNWDYRYTWIRDASFVVYSFIRVGFYREAENFMQFLERRCRESITLEQVECGTLAEESPLAVMYSITGGTDLHEETLDHLEGYMMSQPVRIGNGALHQLQLDMYGELLDAIYLSNKYSKPVSYDFWQYIVYIVNWVCANWRRPDVSLWEMRGKPQHFLYSKVMCWVCVDRALRLADKRSFPAPRAHWLETRDHIMMEVMQKGYNHDVGAFTQAYGSSVLDAAVLILPLILFVSPNDPRMLSTLDAVDRSPREGGLVSSSLVYRYDPELTEDGFCGQKEGTFNMCTFWFIEALSRTGSRSRVLEAQLLFEQFLSYANHLGLFSEELSWEGHHLGNYPQAFTHLQLISCAYSLNRVASSKGLQ